MRVRQRGVVVTVGIVAMMAATVLAVTMLRPGMAASGPQTAPSAGGFRNVGPAELQQILGSSDPVLVDVHVPNEGYLAGTDARIPYTEVAARIGELPADRDAPIVLYCMSGRMSEIAARRLVDLGYRNVAHLAGGMVAWREAGLPVLSE
ncbi:MAG: rhodanese-like domain-containing protein [Chloroflexi bacterium]|nr:rhodanese-like domain-containing protein [Chloroflexota bacterium]